MNLVWSLLTQQDYRILPIKPQGFPFHSTQQIDTIRSIRTREFCSYHCLLPLFSYVSRLRHFCHYEIRFFFSLILFFFRSDFCIGSFMAKRRPSVNRPPTPDARLDQEKEPSVMEMINIKVCVL